MALFAVAGALVHARRSSCLQGHLEGPQHRQEARNGAVKMSVLCLLLWQPTCFKLKQGPIGCSAVQRWERRRALRLLLKIRQTGPVLQSPLAWSKESLHTMGCCSGPKNLTLAWKIHPQAQKVLGWEWTVTQTPAGCEEIVLLVRELKIIFRENLWVLILISNSV